MRRGPRHAGAPFMVGPTADVGHLDARQAGGGGVRRTVLAGVGHNSLVAPTLDAFGVTRAIAVVAAHG